MATGSSRGDRSSGYVFKFVGTAALLVVGTLALVLYVLPERYVLSSGFREGSLNLPSPATPFEPAPPLRIAAIPGITRGPGAAPGDVVAIGPVRGPSELFWEEVLPLLEAGRYRDAIPLFTSYLARYPGDVGARREFGNTLAGAGYRDRAIPILEELLDFEDDDELHLLLARLLRDEGRVADAGVHYRVVLDRRPEDEALRVEWARALSWIEDYDQAEEVLREALTQSPESVTLRAELARVLVYANRLEEARRVLASLTEEELRDEGLLAVRDDVVAWLTPPPDTSVVVPEATPTLLERAIRAREADDFAEADRLFRAALVEAPDDVEGWQAYADFLQYEREDFEGALSALKEVARLTPEADPTLEFRMARLELWTDSTDAARVRLEELLAVLPGPPAEGGAAPPPSRADVLALLGDIHRWDGERLPAVQRYEAALAAEPDHGGADTGLEAIRSEVDRFLVQSEDPGLGAAASSFADTDDFRRYDAAGEWTALQGRWVWSTRSGARWLEGLEPAGGPGDRQGLFADVEGARWWRWGTVRTAARLGVQNVRASDVDLGLGLSARFIGGSGRRTDVRFDHEPAFAVTNTLQSVAVNVRQDRFGITHSQPLSDGWSAAVSAEAASLEHRGISGADRNLRIQVGASVGRALSQSVTLGLASRALRYIDAAPDVTAVPLYWDPDLAVSIGPYLQLNQPVSRLWTLTGRANPGLGYIDERGRSSEIVPDLSGRIGLLRDGTKYRTSIEFFYGQGRFTSYRYYGLDVSFSARGWFGPGFGR
ncbi:MAG: tetratricopeptide repeat protein [Gemmatimonadetes bacterium]|nr:tetratricopeptide repeat protein [Gemmatimonadota bacterium]